MKIITNGALLWCQYQKCTFLHVGVDTHVGAKSSSLAEGSNYTCVFFIFQRRNTRLVSRGVSSTCCSRPGTTRVRTEESGFCSQTRTSAASSLIYLCLVKIQRFHHGDSKISICKARFGSSPKQIVSVRTTIIKHRLPVPTTQMSDLSFFVEYQIVLSFRKEDAPFCPRN